MKRRPLPRHCRELFPALSGKVCGEEKNLDAVLMQGKEEYAGLLCSSVECRSQGSGSVNIVLGTGVEK